MTSHRKTRNYSASVRARLLDLSRERGVDFNLVLQRYAAERFLYRLSVSSEVDEFTLKGAALFRVWGTPELRPTRDIDFLAAELQDDPALRASLEAICAIRCIEDGIVFDTATTRIDLIREDQPYGGLRVRIVGRLDNARIPLQIDVGFGDVITPGRREEEYPTLLDLPVPRLWMYPRETVVAEKLEAMVSLGLMNSRVKDLWDIVCLARRFPFDGETLGTAIAGTFRRRRTPIVGEMPSALLAEYYEDTIRARRWRELHLQIGTDADGPARLVDAGEELRRFVGPVFESLIKENPFTEIWLAGGPWRSGIEVRTGGTGQ